MVSGIKQETDFFDFDYFNFSFNHFGPVLVLSKLWAS